MTDSDLPLYPDGWYAVAYASELRPGDVLTRPFMDGEVVLYRTRDTGAGTGTIHAVDPHCPHLGAHLGHGARVEGDVLRCPFHGFCFDGSGACVSTPYGRKAPPKAKLGVRHVREHAGLVLVHHDAEGRPPAWEVPSVDMTGWSPLTHRSWTFRGHPQETTENSVDVGHLAVVHGYRAVEERSPLELRGPYLTVRYAMARPMLPKLARPVVEAEFTIHVHGLGYSLVENEVPSIGLELRHFVLVTPIGGGKVTMRIAVSIRHPRLDPLFARSDRLPVRAICSVLGAIAMRPFEHDVQQDFEIWRHKRYVSPPLLADGDGPIGAYRRWARQFYPSQRVDQGKSAPAWSST